MYRLLIILFGIVSTVAVAILLLLLYRYANEKDVTETLKASKTTERFEQRKKPVGPTTKWLEDLAVKKRPSFAYAVTEMEIDLPLKKRPAPKRAYRLFLKDIDDYKMFCVRQVLERNGIRYAMFRKGSKGILMIDDLDRKRLKRIVDLVREYDITIQTENYVKD